MGVFLARLEEAAKTEGEALRELPWVVVAVVYDQLNNHPESMTQTDIPKEDTSFVDVTGHGRCPQRGHAIVAFMRMEVARPSGFAVFGLKFVLESGHLHVG